MKIVWSLFDGSGIMGLPWAKAGYQAYYFNADSGNHGATLTIRLQPEEEPLSPFCENDRVVVTVPEDLMIDVEVR